MTEDNNMPSGWRKSLTVFFFEILVATIIFIFVSIPAVGLNFLVKWLANGNGVDPIIILGLTALEYTIFTVDITLCMYFIVKSAIKMGKEL